MFGRIHLLLLIILSTELIYIYHPAQYQLWVWLVKLMARFFHSSGSHQSPEVTFLLYHSDLMNRFQDSSEALARDQKKMKHISEQGILCYLNKDDAQFFVCR